MQSTPALIKPLTNNLESFQTIENRYTSQAQLDNPTTLLKQTKNTNLGEFVNLKSKFPSNFKIVKRNNSLAVSERLVHGWYGISYVRKMSAEGLKATPVETPLPSKPIPGTKGKAKDYEGYAMIQRRSQDKPMDSCDPRAVDLRKPWDNLLDSIVKPPAPPEPKIYDRGLLFLEQKNGKLNQFKKSSAPGTQHSLGDTEARPQPPQSWRNFSSNDEKKKPKNDEAQARRQKRMQEQYEKHIAERVEQPKPKKEPRTRHTVSGGSEATIADRNQLWAQRREERLEEIRKGKKDSELDMCTFKPKINKGFIVWN